MAVCCYFPSWMLQLPEFNSFFFFWSETKKNILIEEKIQEKEKLQKKEKKPREGWEVLPTQTEQRRKLPTIEL